MEPGDSSILQIWFLKIINCSCWVVYCYTLDSWDIEVILLIIYQLFRYVFYAPRIFGMVLFALVYRTQLTVRICFFRRLACLNHVAYALVRLFFSSAFGT